MNVSEFQNAVEGAVFEALDIGETYGSIQVLVRNSHDYVGVYEILRVTYKNGKLYIHLGDQYYA